MTYSTYYNELANILKRYGFVFSMDELLQVAAASYIVDAPLDSAYKAFCDYRAGIELHVAVQSNI